ncbi:YggT family protein, partial [Mesorhizobium sp. M2A.F.Ca.ET.067.02.1.1]
GIDISPIILLLSLFCSRQFLVTTVWSWVVAGG